MVIFLSEQLVENSLLIKMSSAPYMHNFNENVIIHIMIINFYFVYIRVILEK